MRRAIEHFILCALGAIFLFGCNNTKPELQIHSTALKMETNVSNNGTLPAELYFTIEVKNTGSKDLFLKTNYAEGDRPISGFYFEILCNGSSKQMFIDFVTSNPVYLKSTEVDTINLRSNFYELKRYSEECGFENMKAIVDEIAQNGQLGYLPSDSKINAGGIDERKRSDYEASPPFKVHREKRLEVIYY